MAQPCIPIHNVLLPENLRSIWRWETESKFVNMHFIIRLDVFVVLYAFTVFYVLYVSVVF